MTVSRELREATATVVEAMTKAELIACIDNDDFVTARVVALMEANAASTASSVAVAEREAALAAMYAKVEGKGKDEGFDPSARCGVLMLCESARRSERHDECTPVNLDMTEGEFSAFAGAIEGGTVHPCPSCGCSMVIADIGCYSSAPAAAAL